MNERLSPNEEAVFRLLATPGTGYLSPTRIARRLHPDTRRHSAWASPICKRLVEKGLAVRNERGHYRMALSAEAYDTLAALDATPEDRDGPLNQERDA